MVKNIITDTEQLAAIHRRIMRLRETLGITAAALAKKSGVDTSTFYRIEGRSKKERSVSERNIHKIADACHVNPEWLMGLTGDDDTPEFTESCMEHTEDSSQNQGETVADRIRQLRKTLGFSQHKLAEHTGVSLSMLSAIEQGRIKLSVDFARRISQKCDGITAEWLLYGEEYPVNDDLIEWLKNNREERVRLWNKMNKEKGRK